MPQTNKELIELLKTRGVLKSRAIEKAMLACPREYFVPKDYLDEAYGNYPLPLGEGQTISQPLTVIFILELLEVKAGQKVLEVGFGSGWQTAMLSFLVGQKGRVFAFEIKKGVASLGKANLTPIIRIAGVENTTLFQESYTPKFKEFAPYDRIISGAAFSKIPQDLIATLAPNGRLVAPTQENDIRVISKTGKGNIREQIIPGF
ncbi:MAG: protein-L-isoaspartate O-methyltransferase, partial [bacterium]